MHHRNMVYSGIDRIPDGHAEGPLIKGCLCIEGGAFRGLYNQGVLDVLMEQRILFEAVIGVSAGALAGMNYVSGQIGRSARANLRYRHNPDYIGVKAMKKSRSPLRLDFLLKDYNAIEALDRKQFMRKDQRFVAVASNCETGETEYFEKRKCRQIMRAIKASASMPFISPMVTVDGKKCLDGGCTCKIPYQWAIDEGYEKIVIIKTRPRGFRKECSNRHIAEKFYRHYAEFAQKLEKSDANYNRECDEVDQLENEGRVFVIAPSAPVTVGRLESDMEKLGELYWMGYHDMLEQLDALRAYLNEPKEKNRTTEDPERNQVG